MKNLIRLLMLALLSNLTFVSLAQQNPTTKDKVQMLELEEIKDEISKIWTAILHIGQKILPERDETLADMQARIRKDGTAVFYNPYDTTSIITWLDRDQVLPVLERHPDWLRIEISQKESGWIRQYSAILTTRPMNTRKILRTITRTSNAQIQIIQKLHGRAMIQNRHASSVLAKMQTGDREIRKLKTEIERLIRNISTYYQINFSGVSETGTHALSIADRLSAELGLSYGTSSFGDQYSEAVKEVVEGKTHELRLASAYQLSGHADVDLLIDSRSEILETAFRTNRYELGYRKQSEKTAFQLRGSVTGYRDQFRSINSYRRMQLQSKIVHEMGAKTRLHLQYRWLRHGYEMDKLADYTRHQLDTYGEVRTRQNRTMRLGLRGQVSVSDNGQLSFTHLIPDLQIKGLGRNRQSDLHLWFENLDYPNLVNRNSQRLSFRFHRRYRGSDGGQRSRKLLLSHNHYPENPMIIHTRLSLGRTRQHTEGSNRYTSRNLTLKYFHENPQASFADLRFDRTSNRTLYTQWSTFQRYYYPDENFRALLESNLKAGLQIGGFKFGPVLSLRALLDLQNLEVARDGNYYRIGAFVQGAKTFGNGLYVSVNGAYEYGQVYHEQVIIDRETGVPTPDGAEMRSPVSLRLNANARYRLFKALDVSFNFNYYKIDQDAVAAEGLNPVLASDNLSFKVGINYRYQ